MIYTTHNTIHFFNQINGKVHRNCLINHKSINHRDLFHHCSKDGPYFLFGKLRIRDYRYEPCFPPKKSLLCQIKINTLFNNNYGRKTSKYDTIYI